MNALTFANTKVLVVGGAGFVGSNLCHHLLENEGIAYLWIVDNLLSSDISNVPDDPRVRFIYGSITEEGILRQLPRDFDFVYHLACYHGNQSSIADPFADHDNNTLTSLKLFDALKDFKLLEKVVYSAAGCAVAEKTFDDAKPTLEDAPVSLFHDSPYSISKLIGEMYGNYYFMRYGFPFVKARFQNVYGPREILGAVRWRGRRTRFGVTSPPPLSGRHSMGKHCHSITVAMLPEISSLSKTLSRADCLRPARYAGRSLQPGVGCGNLHS